MSARASELFVRIAAAVGLVAVVAVAQGNDGSPGEPCEAWYHDGQGLEDFDVVDYCTHSIIEGKQRWDKRVVPGVDIHMLAPSQTGFPAWSRQEDNVDSGKGHRGFADYLVPEGATDETPRILYCHGGGYEWYSPQDTYRPVTTRLAVASGMPVLAFDFRKTPEFRSPAQLDDAVQAFEWLAANGPKGQKNTTAIFLAGDSAGGGLALALALYLRDHPAKGGAKVAGITVVSPWTDLTCTGESYTTRRWVPPSGGPVGDPVFRDLDPTEASMPGVYKLVGRPNTDGAVPPHESVLSPLHQDLHDLPPTQIHVGDREVMLSDSIDFAEKAEKAGSPVQLTVWPRMWHTFNQYTEGCHGCNTRPLMEAVAANKQQGDFLKGLANELFV